MSLALLQGCASDGSSRATAGGGDGAGGSRLNSSEPLQAAAMPNAASSAGSAPTNSSSETIARINGKQITMEQLKGPLLEAYGLNVLLNVVQLELAKGEAQKQGITIGPSDVEQERLLTTERMFKGSDADAKKIALIDKAEMEKDTVKADALKAELQKDRDNMLVQFLEQQKVSRPEFELVLQTNAYLRKIAEPQLKGKITDEQLHAAFDSEYGAKVVVRHIQGTPLKLAEAKQRIAKGEKFEDVAKEVSTDRATAALGGEMRPFTLANPFYPEHFKRLAFDLKEGEVSEVIEAGGNYHILKVDRRIPPRAVKFETERDGLKARLYDAVMQAAVKEMRDQLATLARTNLKIDEPVLRDQFQKKLDDRANTIKDQEKIRKEMDSERAESQRKAAGIPTVGGDAPADSAKPVVPAPVVPAPAAPAPAAPAPAPAVKETPVTAPAPAPADPKAPAPAPTPAPAPVAPPAKPEAPAAPKAPAAPAPAAPAGAPAPQK